MIKNYLFTVLLFSCFSVFASNIETPLNLSATLTGGATVCQNSGNVTLIFTGSGGTAPYTFTYTINGGTPQNISTNGNSSSVNLSVNTNNSGTFTYSIVSLQDSAEPNNTVSINGVIQVITITPASNANLTSDADEVDFQGFTTFRVCANSPTEIQFFNSSSLISTNTNYTINWGDGSPSFTGISWTNLSHTYQVGLWTLTYSVVNQSGCTTTRTYKVFVGNNPAVGLGNPGNTDICISSALTFPITGVENNPPGTIYVVSFNDGSTNQTFNHPPPSSITHTFLTSSCGTSSSSGANTFQNSFFASITAINPCDQSAATVVPIRISTPPVANFNLPQNQVCTSVQICMENTSTGGDAASNSGCSGPKVVWSISPNTGFTLASGTLGDDFGQTTNPNPWQSGSQTICPIFNTPGVYTIRMRIGNRCGVDELVRTICVESAITPQFNVNNDMGCTPLVISTTNTTEISNTCSPVTYNWQVSYAAANCGTNSGFSFTGGTNANSQNPSFIFTESGNYTITLTTSSACGTLSTTRTINVFQPPTVSLTSIGNACGPVSITPNATVNGCAPTGNTLTYNWSFPGGTPSSSNSANPGSIQYTSAGDYTISLTVSNSCGASTTVSQTFTISTLPEITNTDSSQTICSGLNTTPISLAAIPSATTFSWTAAATTGVSGFIPSGNSAIIPTQTIFTTGATTGQVVYTITPELNGCQGIPFVYTIFVNPSPVITTQPISESVCFGATPSPLSVSISSGGTDVTYQWFSNTTNSNTGGILISGATNASFTPTANDIGVFYYYVEISFSSNNCSALVSTPAQINVTPQPTITLQPQSSQSICQGGVINPFAVSYSEGSGTPSYQWFSNTSPSNSGGSAIAGATSSSYTPPVFNTAGTFYYYVQITLTGSGCGSLVSQVATVEVVPDPIIDIQPLASQTHCQGSPATPLEVTLSGGLGTVSYQWYSNTVNNNTSGTLIAGATSNSFTPPTDVVGTVFYYVIATQTASGCSVTSATAQVQVVASPTIFTQPLTFQSVCLGGSTTSLSAVVLNGTGTPTYQWFSNTTNSNNGGTAIPGANTINFTPPSTTQGTFYYYLVITFDSGGCSTITSTTATVTIVLPPEIDVQPVEFQTVCEGGVVPAFTVSFSGGAGTPTYQWFSNTIQSNTGGTAINGATNSSYTPPVFTSEGLYYFYVEITLNSSGCGTLSSALAEVNVIPDPAVIQQPLPNQTVCQNSPATPLIVTVAGGINSGFNYQWFVTPSNTVGSGTAVTGATSSEFVPPTDVAGTLYYYALITQTEESGCSVFSEVVAVVVNLAPEVTIQPNSNEYCLGDVSQPLSYTIINGVGTPSIQWFSNTTAANTGGIEIPGATSTEFIPSTTEVGVFYYYAEINFSSIEGDCSTVNTEVVSITVNQFPVISDEAITICSENPFEVIPANQLPNIIPAGTVYTWNVLSITPSGSITGASDNTIPQTSIGQFLINTTTNPAIVVYEVTPTSGDCVGAVFQVVVTVNPAISPNVNVTNSTCFEADNGSITTNIVGGIPPYVITWIGPNGFSASTPSIFNLIPGTYTLLIEDTGDCPYSESFLITEPDAIQITTVLAENSSCFGFNNGAIEIEVSGGTPEYSYTWTKNNVLYSNDANLSNLGPGTYELTVTDTYNCDPASLIYKISEPPLLEVNLINQVNIECFGQATGAIDIQAVGGTISNEYNFTWSGPNGYVSSAQNIQNLFAGTYQLVVTDDNGCEASLTVVLTQSPEIIISYTTTPISCYGANDASLSVTLSGGVPPFQFTWNNLSTSLDQNNLSAGDYMITVTDALGCVRVETINIPEAPVFMVNPIVNQISCFGANNGSINLNLTGGIPPVTLQWSDGSTAGLIRNNLPPGTYTATIADGTPCFIVRTFTIIEPQPLVISAVLTQPTDCLNAASGAINLIVSGGTPPFAYQWSNGVTTEDLTGVVAGNYGVTVTDANGCSISGQFTLIRPNPLVVSVTTQSDADCETREVVQFFTAQASGGVPPYTYQWSSGTVSGSNNQVMQTSINGMVILTVTDALGCTTTFDVNVQNPVIGNPNIATESFGFLTYGIYSINDPIQFYGNVTGDYLNVIWDFGDGTFSNELNPVHTYELEREYIVTMTVTYPFGCVYVLTISLLIEKGYLLVIPNAFTPNNDGLNDTFRPVSRYMKSVRMDVYDSWGSMIYSETGDSLVGWDGRIKGVNAQNGNYYAVVTAETFYGRIIQQNQTFVLIK